MLRRVRVPRWQALTAGSDDSGHSEPTESTLSWGPPVYDATALALEVFSNPYFYDDDDTVAEKKREKRERVFRPDTTIDQIRRQYGDNNLIKLAEAIESYSVTRIVDYFASANVPIERLLAEREIVPLDGTLPKSGEILTYNERRVKGGVPTTIEILDELQSSDKRTYRLCYVLGSSGSGKTFFCLEHLRDFRNDDAMDSVTLYFKAAGLEGASAVDYSSPNAPRQMADAIKERVGLWVRLYLRRVWDMSAPLAMHVCLVLDEAGATPTQGFFDDKAKVINLLVAIDAAKIAQSVFVVACGAGLLSETFESVNEAYYVRMKPWKRSDVEKVIGQFADKGYMKARGSDSASTVAEAIYKIPLLDALTTNARSAYFMVQGIASATSQTQTLRHLGWQAHLSALVPGVVNDVVYKYTDSNGIQGLSEDQRILVAAWVMGGLSELKPGAVDLPVFPGLNAIEVAVANQMLQFNVQRSKNTLSLVRGEDFSASVTPAIAIVLFNMASVFTSLVPGWRGEEEVAALFAAKEAILERWSKHLDAIEESRARYGPSRDERTEILQKEDLSRLEHEFVASLKQVSVYRLRSQVQSSKGAEVTIPMVSKHSILVNAERATFADVIAPYLFLQTKHTSAPRNMVVVNMPVELGKCCLLKRSVNDRALRGILALWDGSLSACHLQTKTFRKRSLPMSVNFKRQKKEEDVAGDKRRPIQGSKAFPANLIQWQEVSDGVEYAKITASGRVVGTGFVVPERPAKLNVRFVLSTNAAVVKLVFAKKSSLIITEESLNGEMQIDPTKLPSKQAKAAWTRFRNSLLPGVTIQFLFTRSRT
jgi:hypothetical protein